MTKPSRRLEVTDRGDITIVRFVGLSTLDEQVVQDIGDQLYVLVEVQNRRNLLLNFSNVEYLSSAALGKLITLKKKVHAIQGHLVLTNLDPFLYEIFTATKLDQLFSIFQNEADGLASFAAPPPPKPEK